jgi:hypothetical protein
LNDLGAAGHTLLQRSSMRSSQRCTMVGKGFRKHAIDRIGPTTIMLNDLVYDVNHGCSLTVVVDDSDGRSER